MPFKAFYRYVCNDSYVRKTGSGWAFWTDPVLLRCFTNGDGFMLHQSAIECKSLTERTLTGLSNLDNIQTGDIRLTLVACPAWERLTPHPALLVLAPVLRSTGAVVTVYDLNVKFWQGMPGHQHLWLDDKSYLWNNESEVEQLFTCYPEIIEKYKIQILESCPHLVLFSINSGSRLFTRRFAELLRLETGVPFVAGGPDCFRSENYDWHVKSGVYQAVCPSEGDLAVTGLVAAFRDFRRLPAELPGFTIIEDGAVHDNGDPERPTHLDD